MYIENNINSLTTNEYNWVAPIEGPLAPEFTASEPNGTAYFTYEDQRVVAFRDKLDPKYESRVIHKEILFVFGVFSINEIQHLYKTKNKETLIIVIESNLSVFNYCLSHKNLTIFSKEHIILFADSQVENIITFLQPILHNIDYAKLLKKINFYFTDYYRYQEHEQTKRFIQIIRQTIVGTINAFGNDVEDSLIGLEHNLKNMEYILRAKDTTKLKGLFKNQPAIVIAAGPSLNKNIEDLKNVKGKALIIAVDTIIERLLNEGIVPDFVCSIERVDLVYKYFYENKNIPERVSLVGPAVLDSRVFEEFKGDLIIPFRNEIAETDWLQKIMQLPESSGISMGSSCAHVAFGIAEHFGCSPIILIGQDLAYGQNEGETHAKGTTYDADLPKKEKVQNLDEVEGYYGGEVKTTKIWTQFKVWFEKRIGEQNLHVIDATEGGARIYLTEQKTLRESIEQYCHNQIMSPKEVINNIGSYQIDINLLKSNLEMEIKYFTEFLDNLVKYYDKIEKMDITHKTFTKYSDHLSVIHYIIRDSMSNKLLFHNLQSVILRYLWAHNSRDQVISREFVQEEKNEQIKLLAVMSRTIYEIKVLVEQALQKLEEENDI